MTDTYTIICHPIDGSADISSTATVVVPGHVSALPASVDLLVNGTTAITTADSNPSASAVPPALSWTSENVDTGFTACDAHSSTGEIDWTGLNSQPDIDPNYPLTMIPPNTGTAPVTYTYTIICHPIDGSPNVSSTVSITVPNAGTSTGTGGSTHHRPPWLEF